MVDQEQEALHAYVELVRFLASSLLQNEVEIEVKGEAGREQLRIALHVPESHRGRVIGKGGRIARAIRTLLNSAAIANHKPVILDIVD